jgi:dTDP-4-dehydrorhamnose reductase
VNRLLITGGSSYLGQHIVPIAARKYEIRYTYYQNDPLALDIGRKLDLRDGQAVNDMVTAWQPQYIIHTAGSNRSADMVRVIHMGAQNISKAATDVGARLIHISTDVVFDGRNAPYDETDRPSPIHAYGRAKALAEDVVAQLTNYVVIRTSLIYGLQIMDLSTKWITDDLRSGIPVTLFSNQMRNPVWVDSLSMACLELLHLDYNGIFNVAGNQALSRAEFGQKLLDWWGIDERSGLSIDKSEDAWPLDCRLDLGLATALLATPLPGVDEVLSDQKPSQTSPGPHV